MFCTKTHCILHQNALHFAPKRTAFSGILHHILPKIAPNLVQMAVVCNKYSFCCIRGLTRLCPKANSRENRFFAARLAVGDENGTHNVKIYADKLTKPHPQPLLKREKPHPPQPLLASPPTPLQGERGVICVVCWQGLTPGDAKRVAVCLKWALVRWPTIYIMVSAMHFAVTDNTCLFGLVCRS